MWFHELVKDETLILEVYSFKYVTPAFDLKMAVHFIKNKIKGNESSNLCLDTKTWQT